MCSNSCSAATRVVATAMMMVMMMVTTTEEAAMPKTGGHWKQLLKSSSGLDLVPLQLDPKALVPSGNFRALENVSISPWTYNISSDDSLFPQLSEARCLLHGCLDKKGQEDLSLESKPIMRQLLLLRRVRAAGAEQSYHFRLESRFIAVGCTCVRVNVQHQQ